MENEIKNFASGDVLERKNEQEFPRKSLFKGNESQPSNEQESPRKLLLFAVKSNSNDNASWKSECSKDGNASKLNGNAPTFETNSNGNASSKFECPKKDGNAGKLNGNSPTFETNLNGNTSRKCECPKDGNTSKLNVNAPIFKTNSQTTLNRCGNSSHANQSVISMDLFPRDLVMSCNPRIWRNISYRNLESYSGWRNDNLMQQPLQCQKSENLNLQRPKRPSVLRNGIISIQLRDGIMLDMTLDKAVRLSNNFKGIDVSISSSELVSGVNHPNGKVNQYGSNVDIMTYDGTHKNDFVRYAKFWKLGISFTSSKSALVYRMDSGGVRSTGDTITDLTAEHTVPIFLCGSAHAERYFNEAVNVANQSNYLRTSDGTDEFYINGFRITQKPYGAVKIHRLDNDCLIRMNSQNTSITLTTPDVHFTATLHDTPHLFGRRETQRVHFDGSCFLVRLNGSSAGFDDNNRLKVY